MGCVFLYLGGNMGLYASEKYMMTIDTFLNNYMGIETDGKKISTHEEMREYLARKWYKNARKVCFSKVTKEDILSGNVLFVKDNEGRVLGYKNPRLNLQVLLRELQESTDPEKLAQIREEILQSQEKCPKIKKKRRRRK